MRRWDLREIGEKEETHGNNVEDAHGDIRGGLGCERRWEIEDEDEDEDEEEEDEDESGTRLEESMTPRSGDGSPPGWAALGSHKLPALLFGHPPAHARVLCPRDADTDAHDGWSVHWQTE